jgi:hypothetical protein
MGLLTATIGWQFSFRIVSAVLFIKGIGPPLMSPLGITYKVSFMDGDLMLILFIGLLFLVTGVGLLFVSVDERAEAQDKKRGWVAPDLPRTNFFLRISFFKCGGISGSPLLCF